MKQKSYVLILVVALGLGFGVGEELVQAEFEAVAGGEADAAALVHGEVAFELSEHFAETADGLGGATLDEILCFDEFLLGRGGGCGGGATAVSVAGVVPVARVGGAIIAI